MHYMFLLFADESQPRPELDSPEAVDAMMAPWRAYNQALRDAGVFIAGDALQPSPTATTLKRPAGETVVTDGPFAETKEQIAGFYMVDCEDLDEALKWAKRCPMLENGSVEVRPLMVFPE